MMRISDIPQITSIDRFDAMQTKWKISAPLAGKRVNCPVNATSRTVYEIFKHLTTVQIL